jgi:hypothetical protein
MLEDEVMSWMQTERSRSRWLSQGEKAQLMMVIKQVCSG